MKNIFQVKTGIQVPLHLMYLDLGQVPAVLTSTERNVPALQNVEGPGTTSSKE